MIHYHTLTPVQEATLRQVLRFALDNQTQLDEWLRSRNAGVEQLSNEFVPDIAYDLLNEALA